MELLSCIIWILIGAGVILKEAHKEFPGLISGIGAIVLYFAVGWIAFMTIVGGLISSLYPVFGDGSLFIIFLIVIVIAYRIYQSLEYGSKLEWIDYGYRAGIDMERGKAGLAQKQILLDQKREELLRPMEYWVPSRDQLERSIKWRSNAQNPRFMYSFEECVQDAWNVIIRRKLSDYEYGGLIRDLDAFKASWLPPADKRPLPYEVSYYEGVLKHFRLLMQERKPSFLRRYSLRKKYPDESLDEILDKWREETACELTRRHITNKDYSFPIRQIQKMYLREEAQTPVAQAPDEPEQKRRRRRVDQSNSTDT